MIGFRPQATRQAALALRQIYLHDRKEFEKQIRHMGAMEKHAIASCWQYIARPSQLRPKDCKPVWLRMAGRGEGKTRSAAEETLDICEDWGRAAQIILCSKTIGDVIKVMIKGQSGLMECARRRGYELRYYSSESTVVHPLGGAMHLCTSEKPDKPRGLQCNYFWADEIAAWQHAMETFDNIMYAWRLPCPGGPKAIITTTPRPNPIMLRLTRQEALQRAVTITRGRTLENQANLAPLALNVLRNIYEGTRLGRQELEGELLNAQSSIVEQDVIHEFRVRHAPELARRIVALDPSIDDKEDSDAAGIMVLGADGPANSHPDVFVLDDLTLEQASFNAWATAAVMAFIEYDCDCIVAEVNQGGSGIRETIQAAAVSIGRKLGREIVVPVRSVWAKESKRARAEPVGALYERGRVHHVGHFLELERELTSWMPGMKSPNRMDALVHGVAHLTSGDHDTVGPLSGYLDD